MQIRAVDMPETRAALMQFLQTDYARLDYWSWVASTDYHASLGMSGQVLGDIALGACAGELFHVDGAMAGLALSASRSLPYYELQSDDLPSPSGVIVFGSIPDEFTVNDVEAGEHHTVRGFMWTAAPSAVWVIPLSDTWTPPGWDTGVMGTLFPASPILLPCDAGPVDLDRSSMAIDDLLRILRATWLLMQQPLARVVETDPDRAARKRLRRMGYEPQPVRVIELRRLKNSGGQGDSSREYHHQWIVRGHWRQQWHPKRQVHRPVWIAPHIKGPEDAPMLGGEKVYAWKR